MVFTLRSHSTFTSLSPPLGQEACVPEHSKNRFAINYYWVGECLRCWRSACYPLNPQLVPSFIQFYHKCLESQRPLPLTHLDTQWTGAPPSDVLTSFMTKKGLHVFRGLRTIALLSRQGRTRVSLQYGPGSSLFIWPLQTRLALLTWWWQVSSMKSEQPQFQKSSDFISYDPEFLWNTSLLTWKIPSCLYNKPFMQCMTSNFLS